jgi:hypothetical protein
VYSAWEAIQVRDWMRETRLVPVTPNPADSLDAPAPDLSGRDRFVWAYCHP